MLNEERALATALERGSSDGPKTEKLACLGFTFYLLLPNARFLFLTEASFRFFPGLSSSWAQARTFCRNNGGWLAVAKSAATVEVLQNYAGTYKGLHGKYSVRQQSMEFAGGYQFFS